MFLAEVNPPILSNSRALQQSLFSLLQNCKSSNELTQIHAQIVVNGFSQKNYILAKLLSFCVTSGNLIHAQKAFEQVRKPSTIVWNQMIRGYACSIAPHESVKLYNKMESTETKPDTFTYLFLLNACARPSFLRVGEQLHGRLLSNGLFANIFVQTNLLNMYAIAGGDASVLKARRVFNEMSERNVVTWNSMLAGYFRYGDIDAARRIFDDMPERNTVSWTTMIAGCAQSGRCNQALALFREMQRAHVEVDQVTMVATLSACAELGDLKTGRWIHSYSDKAFPFRSQQRLVSLNNALIHMYASCGVVEEAYRVFKEIQHRTTVSWTTMITGFAKQGCGEAALGIFRWMQSVAAEEGIKPDEITFIGVLCACSHTGRVDEGRYYFQCMTTDFGIEPWIEHYGCMVDLLSRAGLLDEAQKLIETMPMEPNGAVWGALLGGCRIHKDVELASHVARQLMTELEPDGAAGYYVLLSNVYATGKRWRDVATVRQQMAEMGVRKPPGRSWIQVDGIIHDFVAGDSTHKDAVAIYEMVDEITRRARLEGYAPKPSDTEVLVTVELEEREELV
ncbi:PREDICTED: pentatricopeptide repeat-containing protein At5g66520-like [Nelumbo nucifera]|uniref:Pentatricopeptide repeat-containing protein At5g66520-like n=2 Tax=Nelumbo nucifera TaxID=4432 RepID=A0A822YGR8_NELNU|nr:PREDICTED: pentatricopeptide repeat-containing protein At5g66520-like [Nelumbo nucifera]DAD31333.1 TPA_asm: hypothetical protein HUJ06_010184 [Nelumbo nucifera]